MRFLSLSTCPDKKYTILGSLDPALHAHIIPRYLTIPEDLSQGPAFFYPKAYRNSIESDYKQDKELMKQIATAIVPGRFTRFQRVQLAR